MKKIIASCTLIALALGLFSQEKQCVPSFSKKLAQITQPLKQSMQQKSDTIYWSEDFDGANWSGTVDEDEHNGYEYNGSTLPEGWTIYDGNDLDYYWHWSDVGPRGTWTSNNGAWTPRQDLVNNLPGSSENGFMILESDFYNTTASGEMSSDLKSMDSYIQYGPIDLSEAEHVLLEFNQMFRYCCYSTNTLDVFISNDFDPENNVPGNWVKYNTKSEVKANDYTPDEFRSISTNISQTASNQSNVYIRWHHMGSSATHYFWMIDDVVIKRPPDYELMVRDGWADYIDTIDYNSTSWDNSYLFYGGYTSIPVESVGPFRKFRAAIENFGINEQTINFRTTINFNGTEVYNEISNSKTITTTQIDTFIVETDFIPEGIGLYQVSATINQPYNDTDFSNNSWGYSFQVSQNRYSRVRLGNESNFTDEGTTDWADAGYDGDAMAQCYVVPDGVGQVKATGASVFFGSHRGLNEELEAIASGQYSMIAKVLPQGEYTNIPGDSPAIAESELYHLSIEDTSSWIFVPFIDEGNLYLSDSSYYWVSIEVYNGNTGWQRLNFDLGADNEHGIKQPFNGGAFYSINNNEWFSSYDNYAIDLLIGEIPENPDVTLNFNVDMSYAEGFDPQIDEVYVTGSFTSENDWDEPGTGESIQLIDSNNDLVYTGSVVLDTNELVQYKYFLNQGWDQPEFEDSSRELQLGMNNHTTNDYFSFIEAEAKILSFKVPTQVGEEIIEITEDRGYVTLFIEEGTDITALTPTIEISGGATITPESGTPQNFTNTVVYLVYNRISDDNLFWEVNITEEPSHDATLSNILIDNRELSDFHIDSLIYTYPLPSSYDSIPEISAITTDPQANLVIIEPTNLSGAEMERSAKLNITAEDDTTILQYIVIFELCEEDTTTIHADICDNEFYDFYNQQINTTGKYYKTLTSQMGCDSIIQLNLMVHENTLDTLYQSICPGDTITFGTQLVSAEGKYIEAFESTSGCDSVIVLMLSFNNTYEITETATICEMDSVFWNGNYYNSPGTYYANYHSAQGCDSTRILIVHMGEEHHIPISTEICKGESFEFDGQDLTESGSYTATFISEQGCDSVVSLALLVNEVETGIIKEGSTLTAKAQNAEYQWLDCNNSHLAIPNETNAEFVAPATSYYALQVSQNNCVDTSECISVFGLGVKDNSSNSMLEIYPNPANNELNISHLGDEKITNVTIYNIHGKKVFEKSVKLQASLNINIAHLEKGLYAIKVSTTNKQCTQSFIKK